MKLVLLLLAAIAVTSANSLEELGEKIKTKFDDYVKKLAQMIDDAKASSEEPVPAEEVTEEPEVKTTGDNELGPARGVVIIKKKVIHPGYRYGHRFYKPRTVIIKKKIIRPRHRFGRHHYGPKTVIIKKEIIKPRYRFRHYDY